MFYSIRTQYVLLRKERIELNQDDMIYPSYAK